MKRRKFVKNIGFASMSFPLISNVTFPFIDTERDGFTLKETFSLSGFEDEQEEYPSLVSNEKGDNWLFSLRRLPYPNDKEEIAAYHLIGEQWEEAVPASQRVGQYENPSAVCLPNGEPIVCWSKIENGFWSIIISHYQNGKPSNEFTLNAPQGKDVRPKLVTTKQGKIYIIWENYYQKKFSIYLSSYQNGKWLKPIQMTSAEKICFDPAITEGDDGKLYLVYGTTDDIHQNIELGIFETETFKALKVVPIAIGGDFKDRVNLNTKPAIAFDKFNRLWISWENNKDNTRLDDGDNFPGDRCCAMVCYTNNELLQQASGKWLFNGKNDQLPSFIHDKEGNLFVVTRCGGDFGKDPFWKFRISGISPTGWTKPETFLSTNQKGPTSIPTLTFHDNNHLWMAWRNETFNRSEEDIRVRQSRMNLSKFNVPQLNNKEKGKIELVPCETVAFRPTSKETKIGGRNWIEREKKKIKGEEYTLLQGNLHEHTETSYCWPAGCEATLHDDYRYAMYSEGYDFIGITDHTKTIDEPYWRRSLRLADFYNEEGYFIAIPAAEWTLSPPFGYKSIPYGVGHRNIVFTSTDEAKKLIRNAREIFSEYSPETDNAPKLWKLIRDRNIDCVAIPHHVADEVHPTSWEERDEEIEPVVEIFQCRGNSEYPGCPRENNLSRHQTTHFKEAFIDYALSKKQHKLGFIASGDHNSMGVGLAALWVKELSRFGIIEALRARRCFATTGDKLKIDFAINDQMMGQTLKSNNKLNMNISVKSVSPLKSVELLKNSKVIKTWELTKDQTKFSTKLQQSENGQDPIYYYVRAIQQDEEIVWSSPIFIEKMS